MHTEQLRHYLAIVRCMNFTAAAEGLYLSQSTLSKQMHNLEEELCVELFDRTRRQIRLTEAGQVLARHARELLAGQAALERELLRFKNPKSTFQVLSIPVLTYYGLPGRITGYAETHPGLDLHLTECDTDVVIDSLRNKTTDVGIIFEEYLPENDFLLHELYRDEVVAVMGTHHPLAGQGALTLEQLAEETLLVIQADRISYEKTVGLFTAAGITPRLSPIDIRIASIQNCLHQSRYISILFGALPRYLEDRHIVSIPIETPFKRTLSVAVHRDCYTPQCRQFIDFIAAPRPA